MSNVTFRGTVSNYISFFCFDVKGSALTLGASDVCQGQQIFQAVLLVVGLKRGDKSYYLVLGSLAGGLKREKLHRDATKAQKRDSGPIKCVAASCSVDGSVQLAVVAWCERSV